MSPAGLRTYVFASTNAAFWAEEVARGERIPVEVVPAPAEADAACDLALVTTSERAPALEEALKREGVPFGLWPP